MSKRHAADRVYIWISRWERFQHYTPERDRGPAWIKDYTAQLDDERYLRLTDRQRALLRDLRDIFATMRGQLSDDCAMIARRRNSQTRRSDLESLNHAGFIEFVSRAGLDQRLERFYTSRAGAGAHHQEVEVEQEKEDLRTSSCDLDMAAADEEPGPDDEPFNTTTKNGSHPGEKSEHHLLIPVDYLAVVRKGDR